MKVKRSKNLGYFQTGTPGVAVFELIKRAYGLNALEKLRDFLTVESPEFQPEAV
jgi:hypothetical protein